MSPQIIKLIISALALLIIGVQVLFGAIRGFKKSTFRLVWLFAWGVVCLLLSAVIAKALVNIDISFLHLNVNGEEISTLPAYIQKLLESSNPNVAQAMADNPQMYELCVQIAISIINLVVFELLFWVVKWLLYPLWAVLARIFFKKSKNKTKSEESNVYVNKREKKQKKHALLGMLIGLASGVVVLLFAFIPLKTISDLAVLVEAETTVDYDGATQKGLVSQYAGDYVDYVYVYENSVVNKALTYTGLGYVQNLGGNILTKTSFNGKSFNLKNEIKTFGNAYVDCEKIVHYDFENITKENINEIIPLANDLQTKVLSSNLLKSVYDEIVPYLVKNMLTDDDYFIKFPTLENETLNQMLRDSACSIFGITITETTNSLDEVVKTAEIDKTKITKIDDIKSDLSKVLELAKDLNNQDLIAGFVKKTETFEDLQQKITVEVADKIVDGLFDLHIVGELTPIVFEPAMEQLVSLAPSVEYDGIETTIEFTKLESGIQTENVEAFFKNSVANIVEVFKNIDKESEIYINSGDFGKVGAVLDKLKSGNVVSRDTFDSAMNYVSTFAKTLVDGSSLDDDAKKFIISMAGKLGGVGSYEVELKHVGDAYEVFKEAETIDLETAEKIFDKLLTTYIYTSSKTEIYDYVEDKLDDIDFGDDLADVKNDIIEQFESDKENNINVISVVIQLKDLGDYVQDIKNVPELADIDRAYLLDLGDKIDNMSNEFDLVVNASAQRKVGEYAAKTINQKVQESILSTDMKAAVQTTYDDMSSYTSFKTMFEKFADDLQLDE